MVDATRAVRVAAPKGGIPKDVCMVLDSCVVLDVDI
jgi:hypothetical protein